MSAYLKGDSEAVTEYAILEARTKQQIVLFPMPKRNKGLSENLEEQFINTQKRMLFNLYAQVYSQLRRKYGVLWNKVIPLPGIDEEKQEDYYANNEKSKELREEYFNRLITRQRDEYLQQLSNVSFRTKFVDMINSLLKSLDLLEIFKCNRDYWIQKLKKELKDHNALLTELQQKLDSRTFMSTDYYQLNREASFREITDGFFTELLDYTKEVIERMAELHEIDLAETDLVQLCNTENLTYPTVNRFGISESAVAETKYITYDVFENIAKETKLLETIKKIKLLINERKSDIIQNSNGQSEVLVDGEEGFALYFKNNRLSSKEIPENRIAVINDLSKKNIDLVFTADKIVLFIGKKKKGSYAYEDIHYSEQNGKAIINTSSGLKYQNPAVNLRALFKLIETIQDAIR